MKVLPLILAGTLAMSSVQAAAQTVDIEQLAALIRANLPRAFGRYLVLVDAQAEDGVLVVVVTGPQRAFDQLGEAEIARLFANGFCRGENRQSFFDAGLRLRVDTRSESGRRTRGSLIDHCPDTSQVS